MAKQKRFQLPKFKNRTVAIFWIIFILITMAFVDKRQSERVCQKVTVKIDNEYNNYFIEDRDVMRLMTVNEKENLINNIHQFIDLKILEKRVKEHGFVDKVIVSKDLKGNIFVKVRQYQPLVRLALGNGTGRYVSSKGKILPLSERFTARVMVLEGSFNGILAKKDWSKDSLRTPYLNLVKEIEKDEFLKTMVASMSINWKGEIKIFPQIGKQEIEFGKPDNIDTKLLALKAFYRKIVPVKGWNEYSKVNLKFDDQMICE
jgi:cell division protein FtsQ